MAVFKVSKVDCEKILELPKEIDQDFRWFVKGNGAWVEANLPIKVRWLGNLEMRITVNTQLPEKYSMSILLNQSYPIKRLDINGSHNNKCSDGKKWAFETHKHSWSDVCPDGHAYTPTDITGTTIEEVFGQFCKECNINFHGKYNPALLNPEMSGI